MYLIWILCVHNLFDPESCSRQFRESRITIIAGLDLKDVLAMYIIPLNGGLVPGSPSKNITILVVTVTLE